MDVYLGKHRKRATGDDSNPDNNVIHCINDFLVVVWGEKWEIHVLRYMHNVPLNATLGWPAGNPVKPKITENSKYGDKKNRVVNNYLIKHQEWRWIKKKSLLLGVDNSKQLLPFWLPVVPKWLRYFWLSLTWTMIKKARNLLCHVNLWAVHLLQINHFLASKKLWETMASLILHIVLLDFLWMRKQTPDGMWCGSTYW